MATETPDYNCSQQDLYSALNTLWDNYVQDLLDFSGYKAMYNAGKATAAKAAIKAAKDLPDEQARTSVAEQWRVKVVKKAAIVTGNFLYGMGYINGAFAPEFREANYDMAGQGYYRKATLDDWESVSGLGASLVPYLTNNSVVLQAGGQNMPASFPATVAANVAAFESDYAAFKSSSQTGVLTDAKIKANNAIYATARELMEDARFIYHTNSAKADRYIFSRILSMINPTVAGLRGNVLNSATNIGEADANVTFKVTGKPDVNVTTNADGYYEVTGIQAGSYVVEVSKVGFQKVNDTIVIKAGVVSKKDFSLTGV